MEETSAEFVGRWSRLVSTTNWEKGRIICEWRQTLAEAGAPARSYTDDAWSRRAGGVTPQHVGRLRRVYRKFGESHQQYDGLYWSHFQAAVDWPDAEMWLEGAVQNRWSVSEMRQQRWEAIGAPPDKKPRDEDIVVAELDEDFAAVDEESIPQTIAESLGIVRDEDALADRESSTSTAGTEPHEIVDGADSVSDVATAEPVRPFETLPDLPPDVAEAFESFKLAILRHKVSGWEEISPEIMLAVLDALGQLVLAPAEA